MISLKAIYLVKNENKAFTETPWLLPWGAFVWGDAVVFGLFWFLISTASLLLKDWLLFWLVYSLFWVMRSLGETIYWLNQQFAVEKRDAPEKYWIYKIFKNESVWFVMQISWQCATVVSLVAAIYLASLWL